MKDVTTEAEWSMTDPCREMIRLQGEERERKRLFLTITLFLKNLGSIWTFVIFSIFFEPAWHLFFIVFVIWTWIIKVVCFLKSSVLFTLKKSLATTQRWSQNFTFCFTTKTSGVSFLDSWWITFECGLWKKCRLKYYTPYKSFYAPNWVISKPETW